MSVIDDLWMRCEVMHTVCVWLFASEPKMNANTAFVINDLLYIFITEQSEYGSKTWHGNMRPSS